MKLIAKKLCNFGGKKFYIGDEIPAALVKSPKLQEGMGVLAIVKEETMEVVIHAEEGDLPLRVTKASIQAVVDVLTSNVEDAETIVKTMDSEDSLILLHAVDNRKAIKAAAQAQAQSLSAGEAGDQ